MAESLSAGTKRSNVSNDAIAHGAVELEQAQRAIDEGTARKRAILKRLKSNGINTESMLQALAFKRGEEEAIRTKIRDTLRYSAIVAPHIKLTQSELFDFTETPALSPKMQAKVDEADSEASGYAAGKGGTERRENPHPQGSSLFVGWDTGWLAGQRIMNAELGLDEKIANPSREKPKRGRAAAVKDDDDAPTTGVEGMH